MPTLAKKCIASWKEKLPDYEIKLWDEKTFDVQSTFWTSESYALGDYAFVADYVRVYALHKYGGIYMDVDMEIVKDFSSLLSDKEYVSGFIEGCLITCGFIACEKSSFFINRIYDYYLNRHYLNNGIKNNMMNPLVYTKLAITYLNMPYGCKEFFTNSVSIYADEFFNPYCRNTIHKNNEFKHAYKITTNTYTIHLNMGSWFKKRIKISAVVRFIFPRIIYLLKRFILREK